jgi:hypothetical protein
MLRLQVLKEEYSGKTPASDGVWKNEVIGPSAKAAR